MPQNTMPIGFFSKNYLTNPEIVGGAQAFNNSIKGAKANQIVGSAAEKAIDKAGDAMQKGSKLTKGLDMANKFVAPLQAGIGLVGLGADIWNSVEANKQMKEQMDLAKKNFNLELEKQQKQELAHNQLAASIDKAWGGSGKVSPTINYAQYKAFGSENEEERHNGFSSLGGNGLVAGGARSMDIGANSKAGVKSIDTTLSGSGNMPTLTGGQTMNPIGHSDSMSDTEEEAGAETL